MALKIFRGDCLEKLAKQMFANGGQSEDPFEEQCTVVGSHVATGWLKQYYLFDLCKSGEIKLPRVLANHSFIPLHAFVDQWLEVAAGETGGSDEPSPHPYSQEVLQWRVWNALLKDNSLYRVLQDYVSPDGLQDLIVQDRRRWGLAGKIAQLFFDYQLYRSDLLTKWEGGEEQEEQAEHDDWQAELWRALVREDSHTLSKQFEQMTKETLNASGIVEKYRRITVFNTSSMPKAYFNFFKTLSEIIPVEFYLFNPSKVFALNPYDKLTCDPSDVQNFLERAHTDAASGKLDWMELQHPLLSGFGQGIQSFLPTIFNDGKAVEETSLWGDDADDSLLHQVQASIRSVDKEVPAFKQADDSIQIHSCHSPMREIEVVRDLIFRWFEEHPESQPQDIQVLVPDFETYVPFVEAVFRPQDINQAIPCVISRNPPTSAGSIGSAYIQLLRLNESRMTAPEVMELLQLEPIRTAFHLTPEDVSLLSQLVHQSGIRWGRDGEHINRALKLDDGDGLPDAVTWRRGLDRMLAGWALGERCEGASRSAETEDAESSLLYDGGNLGELRPHDGIEGHSAKLLGILGSFYEALCETADQMVDEKPVQDWVEIYNSILDTFFTTTEHSFLEMTEIRRAIREVGASASADPVVSQEVMIAAIEVRLGGSVPGGKCAANAVLFSPLRTMQVTPRKMIVMMGLSEDAFPRGDNRLEFDRIERDPEFGDRSNRRDDRLAFLEALMCARDRLMITYTGQSISDNAEIPPSPAVTELIQTLAPNGKKDESDAKFPVIKHALNAFNPQYFKKNGEHFSYSASNYAAAKILVESPVPKDDVPEPSSDCSVEGGGQRLQERVASEDDASRIVVTFDDLNYFFRNPAKSYFRSALSVRLDDPVQDSIPDGEPFDVGVLEKYLLDQELVERLLPGKSLNLGKLTIAFQEQALIPLGQAGYLEIAGRHDEIKQFLDGTCIELDTTYMDINRKLKSALMKSVAVDYSDYTVTANIPIIEFDSGTFAVCFRYASVKPKDMISAWLVHVLGHASGEHAFSTVLIGKEGVSELFAAIGPQKAKAIVGQLVEQYKKGMKALFPFTPETSKAFADYLDGKVQPTELVPGDVLMMMEDVRDEALNAAKGNWNGYTPYERDEAYFKQAWGAEGPMADEDQFMKEAWDFWGPYFEHKNSIGSTEKEAKQ